MVPEDVPDDGAPDPQPSGTPLAGRPVPDSAAPHAEPAGTGEPAPDPQTPDPQTPDPQTPDDNAAAPPDAPARRRRRWRRALLASAVVLAVIAGGLVVGGVVLAARFNGSIKRSNLLGSARASHGPDINGPLNFLLIGSNYRQGDPSNGERADTIMIVHVTADLDHAYLISVPRDLYYTIKPYPLTGYAGSTEKIDAALNYGGMPLMSQTISDLTGLRFDGAVYTRFSGFQTAVGILGGVNMCVDEKTVSVHIGHTVDGKFAAPYTNTGGHPIPVPGVTPQVYYPGCQHMAPWQALDFVRQRELLPNGDYDRQRHQQQFIFAVLKQTASAGVLADPVKLDRVLRAIGSAMTIDTNGVSPLDYILALRHIRASSLVGLRAPSHPVTMGGTDYVVGDPGMSSLWQAIRDDTLAQWAAANPTMVNPLNVAAPGASPSAATTAGSSGAPNG